MSKQPTFFLTARIDNDGSVFPLKVQCSGVLESRIVNVQKTLRLLTKIDPRLNNKIVAVSFADDSFTPWKEQVDLRFSTVHRTGEKRRFLRFPCPYTLSWPEVEIFEAQELIREMMVTPCTPPANNRIFWRGANTHAIREAVIKYGKQNSETCDFEFTSWHPKTTNHVPLRNHIHYKYLLDCQGFGYSARLKWLLAMGRPVFVVQREDVEWWHDLMIPWVHFVPVMSDLSDLIPAYHRLESGNEGAQIGANARQFVREHILLSRQLQATLDDLS